MAILILLIGTITDWTYSSELLLVFQSPLCLMMWQLHPCFVRGKLSNEVLCFSFLQFLDQYLEQDSALAWSRQMLTSNPLIFICTGQPSLMDLSAFTFSVSLLEYRESMTALELTVQLSVSLNSCGTGDRI